MRFILPALLLMGCTTTAPIVHAPIETKNQEKDKYIDKVESIVSDSASALTAVVPNLAQGNVRGLVEAQVTRLSGVSKPSVAKVEEYTRILKQNDSKAIQKDKDEAAKVDKETDTLWAVVQQKDIELEEANTRADAEFKQKVLWKFSMAGLGIFTAGIAVLAFTPFKAKGFTLMGGGALAMASLWIFDSQWFSWIAGVSIGLVALMGVILLLKKITSRTPLESYPRTQESADQHSPQ
jgi:hypothetical protein